MKETLILFGASLMDAGNISHATDKFVLSEQIARQLRARKNDAQLLNPLSNLPKKRKNIYNYAHGGTHSGPRPYSSSSDADNAIALPAQVDLFEQSADFYKTKENTVAIISSGANDILDAMEEGLFKTALETKNKTDERKLVKSIIRSVSGNLKHNVDRITGIANHAVILNQFPLKETPYVKEIINESDYKNGDLLINSLERISLGITKKINHHFRNKQSVAIVDIQPLWDKIKRPEFIDAVHPSSRTNSKLAELILSTSAMQLPDLGQNL